MMMIVLFTVLSRNKLRNLMFDSGKNNKQLDHHHHHQAPGKHAPFRPPLPSSQHQPRCARWVRRLVITVLDSDGEIDCLLLQDLVKAVRGGGRT